jgi:hypothetical protein
MIDIRPFRPADENFSATLNTPVTGVASSVTLVLGIAGKTVRILNSGTQTIFVRMVSASGGAATVASSMPMLPNTVETFFASTDVLSISAIAAGAGSTMYVTVGDGA